MDIHYSEPAAPAQNKTLTHKSKLGWWCNFIAPVLGCTIAFVLITFFDLYVAASWILITVVGYVLYRWTELRRSGIVLWCLAAAAISITMPMAFSVSYDVGSGTKEFFSALGILLTIASTVVFIIAAALDRTRFPGNCGGAVLALSTFIISCAAVAAFHGDLSYLKEVKETTQTIVELHKIGNEVEKFKLQLGRLPNNEEELVNLRGKPMPTNGRFTIVNYYKLDDNHYSLNSSLRSFWGRHWDLFGYVLSYYGPHSTRRIYADLF
jgi:hypothetical protein